MIVFNMLFTIIVTTECNLHCRYCGGKLGGMPSQIQYSLKDLQNFVKQDSNPIVAFYGGEPLLEPEIIKKMINVLPAKRFVLTTNGTGIHKLENYIKRIDTVLFSIDGRPETTDYYRGKNSTARIFKGLEFLKRQNYSGEIIARMTVSHRSDIYPDVMYLLDFFPFVHWQLDVIWSKMWDLDKFRTWTIESYKPGLVKLVDFWVYELKQNHLVGIVPFLGIVSRMLNGGKNIPCQAGTDAVAVATDGKILACPIASDFEWNILGNFKGYNKIFIGEPCRSCSIYQICGGRCLFSYKERLWNNEGFREICKITKFLVNKLAKHKKLYETKKNQLLYPLYNNTTEIIP